MHAAAQEGNSQRRRGNEKFIFQRYWRRYDTSILKKYRFEEWNHAIIKTEKIAEKYKVLTRSFCANFTPHFTSVSAKNVCACTGSSSQQSEAVRFLRQHKCVQRVDSRRRAPVKSIDGIIVERLVTTTESIGIMGFLYFFISTVKQGKRWMSAFSILLADKN